MTSILLQFTLFLIISVTTYPSLAVRDTNLSCNVILQLLRKPARLGHWVFALSHYFTEYIIHLLSNPTCQQYLNTHLDVYDKSQQTFLGRLRFCIATCSEFTSCSVKRPVLNKQWMAQVEADATGGLFASYKTRSHVLLLFIVPYLLCVQY